MIMLAKVVSYGGNAVRYALEKEKAKLVKTNHMPEGIDPTAIWYRMKHHCQLYEGDRMVGRKLERYMVTFVLSPSKEESADFTPDDWAKLQDEALETLDSIGLTPKGQKEKVKTNFSNSMNVGGLHSDSKSGTLHLHIDCCRVDMDGHTNDVHDIHLRAMRAAEIINLNHGWVDAQEIRNERKEEIANLCESVLRKMNEFSMDEYFQQLKRRGCKVSPRYDKTGKLVGYTVGKNASVFKASEIGRKFMASKIAETWKKLHPTPVQTPRKPTTQTVRPTSPLGQKPTVTQPHLQPKTETSYSPFHIDTGREVKLVRIPNAVKDIFLNEAQIPEGNDTATMEDISHVAMLLFAGYLDAATSVSDSCGGGGGSAPSTGWGKDEDEDDRKFALRCVQMAHSMCKPKPRSRGFRR
jgi:hypothetical protein